MSSLLNIAAGSQAGGFYGYEIDNSLRFDDGSSAYLNRTNGSAPDDVALQTISLWVKRADLTTGYMISGGSASTNEGGLYFGTDDKLFLFTRIGTTVYQERCEMLFRDTSAWYHIHVKINTGDSGNEVRIWVNGAEQTLVVTNSAFSSASTMPFTKQILQNVGRRSQTSNTYFDGYLAEVNVIDGQALDPTSFGESKSGVWIPKNTSGLTFGTNGFRLEFGDSSAIGDDTSGNGNDWTANNLSAHDVVPDSPTNNYAVVNPLARADLDPRVTLSEGNLNISAVTNSDSNFNTRFATISLPSSGKYYAECRAYVISSNGNQTSFGVVDPDAFDANEPSSKTLYNFTGGEGFDGFVMLLNPNNAQAYSDGATSGSQITGLTATAYILKLALDIDNGKVFVGYDGVWLNSADPAAGTGEIATRTFTTSDVIAIQTVGNSSGNNNGSWLNFGQDSTFGGNVTAGGNSDDNGYGDFAYAVPSGYLALNSANLPEPAISPLDDEVPEDYFNTVLYEGDGSVQAITGVGFQPDWVWIKNRDATDGHNLIDSVRGVTIELDSSGAIAEFVNDDGLTAFGTDGFTVGDDVRYNTNNESYVSWNWLAGGTAVSNTEGSITSSISANTKAGFNIVTYTGNSSSTATVGHGLGVAPKVVAIKSRNATDNWQVSISNITGTLGNRVYFNLSQGVGTDTTREPTKPSSSVISIGGNDNTNGGTYVAYCFASIEGFSKFGSYVGGSSATDNTFVYTGFRPAWVVVKQTNGTGSWHLFDNKRTPTNVVNKILYANVTNAEVTYTTMDFVSNGFKFRTNQADISGSGQTYLFMAFAEMPFKYANAR